jgi:hypothetical protein
MGIKVIKMASNHSGSLKHLKKRAMIMMAATPYRTKCGIAAWKKRLGANNAAGMTIKLRVDLRGAPAHWTGLAGSLADLGSVGVWR